jgi:hypothetical protein
MQAAAANEQRRQAQAEQEQNTNLFDLMIRAVQETLSIGASVCCPHCAYRGEKDDACMHIVCENCRVTWCYCCGRRRRTGTNLCSTCDVDGIFIQAHTGWNIFQVENNESQGYAALHEFHRKRMAYFLRRLVEGVPDLPWADFWNTNGTLLMQVPTQNRSISRDDIANATPPYFPPTAVTDLQWLNDCQPIIDSLLEQSRRHIGGGENEAPSGNPSATTHGNNVATEHNIQALIDQIIAETSTDPDLQQALLESLLEGQNSNQNGTDLTNNNQPRRRRFMLRRRRNNGNNTNNIWH